MEIEPRLAACVRRREQRLDRAACAAVRRIRRFQQAAVVVIALEIIDERRIFCWLRHIEEHHDAVGRLTIERQLDRADHLARRLQRRCRNTARDHAVASCRRRQRRDDRAVFALQQKFRLLILSCHTGTNRRWREDARCRARRCQIAVGIGRWHGLDRDFRNVRHLLRENRLRLVVEIDEAVHHLVAALRRHEIRLVEIPLVEIRPCHEVRHLVRCDRLQHFAEPVGTLVARLSQCAARISDEDARLRHGRELVMPICEIIHGCQRLIKAGHPAVVFLRVAMIHVDARDVDERIARIASGVIGRISNRAIRRIGIEQVVQAFLVAQVFDRRAIEVLELARCAVRRAPPEPAAVVFMERAENHGYIRCLHAAKEIRHEVEITRIDIAQVAARQDALHDIALRMIWRIARIIIPAIHLRTLCHLGEVRHVAAHRQNGAFMLSFLLVQKRAPGRNGRELFLSFRSNSPLRFFSKHARHPVNRNEPCAPRLPELSFLKARESSFLPRTCLSHSRVPEAPSLARFFDGHDIINHHVSPSTLLRLTQAAMCP